MIPFIVLLVIFLNNKHGQQWLRGFLEKRWKQPARTVNTFALAGALAGLMSFGVWIIALIIFPLAIAASVKLVGRWGWLDSRVTYAHPETKDARRPLHVLCVAAAAPLLLGWPLFIFWSMATSIVTFPIGAVYGHLRTGIGQQAQEDFMLYVAMALGLLLYCGLLNRAFRRLTGIRSRALAWQLVGWIFSLMLCLSLLDISLDIHNRANSDMLLPSLLTAIVTAYLLKQTGSVFGQWLVRSTAVNWESQ